MISRLLSIFLTLSISFATFAQVNVVDLSIFDNEEQQLSFDEAFKFTITVNENVISLNVQTEPGHYLYREEFDFTVSEGSVSENIQWTNVKVKEDEFRGLTSAIEGKSTAKIEVYQTTQTTLSVRAQGCSVNGICYLPKTLTFDIGNLINHEKPVVKSESANSESKNPISFLLIGFFIALTPCTFPLIPIVLGALGRNKALSAVAYTNGLALSFVTIGAFTTLSGSIILPYINNLPFYSFISLLFLYLAYSMYMDKPLYLGAGASGKINKVSEKSNNDTVKAFVIGIASGVLATPCTAAPLLAVLTHLSLSDDITYTITSLYTISIGISLPLLLVSVIGKKALITPGAWMVHIKNTIAGAIAIYPTLLLLPFHSNIALIYGCAVIICTLVAVKYRYLFSTIAVQSIVLLYATLNQSEPPALTVNGNNDLKGTYILKLQADWCSSCRHNEKIISNIDDISFPVKTLDLTEMSQFESDYISSNKVLGLPLVQFVIDGQVVSELTGEYGEETFTEWVKHSSKYTPKRSN